MWAKVILCLLPFAAAQIPIPKRPLGFVYSLGKADAPVDFDVYMGPLCPDSAAALPTMTRVADHYGPNVLRLKIHLFPLPYHRNSFVVTMGTHAVNQLTKTNMTYDWTTMVYKNIEALSDVSLSQSQLVVKMAGLAQSMGLMVTEFTKLATDLDVNEDCRIAWKYACSRGVTGTPTFMINDVVVSGQASWTLSEWTQVIDPLLKKEQKTVVKENIGNDCKTGTKRCEYLPGKIECCTPGENCIPNVGCRC